MFFGSPSHSAVQSPVKPRLIELKLGALAMASLCLMVTLANGTPSWAAKKPASSTPASPNTAEFVQQLLKEAITDNPPASVSPCQKKRIGYLAGEPLRGTQTLTEVVFSDTPTQTGSPIANDLFITALVRQATLATAIPQIACPKNKPPTTSTDPVVGLETMVPALIPFVLTEVMADPSHDNAVTDKIPDKYTCPWLADKKPPALVMEDGQQPPPIEAFTSPPEPKTQATLTKETKPAKPTPSKTSMAPDGSNASPECQADLQAYRQELIASINQRWQPVKPPYKGTWEVIIQYQVGARGGITHPVITKPSGYSPLDQRGLQTVQGFEGTLPPLPDCFTAPYLLIDHTFRVIYR